MRASVVLAASCAVSAHAFTTRRGEDPNFPWKAPDAAAKRGPCPMLNSLANHGYLARDGKEIDMQDLISGLGKAINFDEALVRTLGTPAFLTSTTGNSSTFNMDDLGVPGVIEHDGSLSRQDHAIGNAVSFNPAIWGETRSYLEAGAVQGKIDYKTMATARSKRLATAKATNPKFNMTSSQVTISLGEAAVILGTLGGSFSAPAAPLEWMNIVFQEERLPFKEGFKTSSAKITTPEVQGLSQLIATSGN